MKKQFYLSIVLISCCLSQWLRAVTVTNPAYQVETYISYDTSAIGRPMDFTFDSSGNVYVTHSTGDFVRNGSIRRIDVDKNVTVLRDDLVDPRYITWGGGHHSVTIFMWLTDWNEPTTRAGKSRRSTWQETNQPFAVLNWTSPLHLRSTAAVITMTCFILPIQPINEYRVLDHPAEIQSLSSIIRTQVAGRSVKSRLIQPVITWEVCLSVLVFPTCNIPVYIASTPTEL